jgi:riboflavin biosynthesis pyrimidine reductase
MLGVTRICCDVGMTDATFEQTIPGFVESLTNAGAITVAVMVSSVDGRATVGGKVGDLTGTADQEVLLGAREHAAAVVVGGHTVHNEGYDGLLGDDARARREAKGLPPEPELVVFTRQSPSLPELWRQLRERYPDGLIVCEGGPTVLGLIVEHQLLDQLVLCLSPRIVGDSAEKRVLEHAGPLEAKLQLLAVATQESFLFLRYGLH